MERLLLDQVDWRLRPPTAFTFLHLLAQALAGRVPPRGVAAAAYLCELSLLNYGMLLHRPSLVAAAAVSVGAARHGGGAAGEVERLMGAPPRRAALSRAPAPAAFLRLPAVALWGPPQ